jgi:hypothetical protein
MDTDEFVAITLWPELTVLTADGALSTVARFG